MNQRNVGGVHSKTRSQPRNHGSSRAARSQNPSGSRRPSSIQRLTIGVIRRPGLTARKVYVVTSWRDDSSRHVQGVPDLRVRRQRLRRDRRRDARRAERRRRRDRRRLLERQLQGRARRDGRGEDPQALPAHRRHRRRRRRRVERGRALLAKATGRRHRLRPGRRQRRRLRRRTFACPPTGSWRCRRASACSRRWRSARPASRRRCR